MTVSSDNSRVLKQLLTDIPGLERINRLILYQGKNYNGSGYPDDDLKGEAIPLGSRVLKVLSDLTLLEDRGMTTSQVITAMRKKKGFYDPKILDTVLGLVAKTITGPPITKTLHELGIGDIIAKDVISADGLLLIKARQVLTEPVIEHLRNYVAPERVSDTFDVYVQ